MLIIFMLPACVKPENRLTYTITGRVVSSRTNEAQANVNLSLKVRKFGYGASWKVIADAYTDAQGVFFLEQVHLRHKNEMKLMPMNLDISTTAKRGDTVNLGDIFINR